MLGTVSVLSLAVVGAIAVVLLLLDSVWSILELISSHLMPYFLPAEDQPLSTKFGPWAVVTGGTDGIGKEYARELAQRGLNIVIISRNPDKLRDTAAQIEKEYSVKTKTVVADFSQGAAVYAHIEEELKDIPIGILVNNVGIQYDCPTVLTEVPFTKLWELININVGAVTVLSRLALGGMAARGRGALVNISSGSELQPLPLMAVYAATKAYVRSFTHAIREEYSSKGIYIQHVSPLFIATKMNAFSARIGRDGPLVPDAATYARHCVATLGRVSDTSGYWVHGIQIFFIKLAPVWLRTKIGAHINKQFQNDYLHNNKAKTS